MYTKPSTLLAMAAWVSFFAECWLLLTRTIPPDFMSWFFLILFFILAVFASSVAYTRKVG